MIICVILICSSTTSLPPNFNVILHDFIWFYVVCENKIKKTQKMCDPLAEAAVIGLRILRDISI